MEFVKLINDHGFTDEQVIVLVKAGLVSIAAIEEHYASHETFLSIQGADQELENKLLNVLVIRMNSVPPVEIAESTLETSIKEASSGANNGVEYLGDEKTNTFDPDLEHLAVLAPMSVRAYNVCNNAGIRCLSDLIALNRVPDGFRKLRNCGTTTAVELRRIVEAFSNEDNESKNSYPTAEVLEDELEQVFREHYSQLSVRARNVLSARIGVVDAGMTIRYFMNAGKKLVKVPGAGAGTMLELRRMRQGMLQAMIKNTRVVNKHVELQHELMHYLPWATRHHVPVQSLAELHGNNGELQLLLFLDNYLFGTDDRSRSRVTRAYLQADGATQTFDEIGASVGLSRERVRQLLDSLDKRFPQRLAFIGDLPGVQERYSTLKATGPIFNLDGDLVEYLNSREGTNWSLLFFLYIAQQLNASRYTLCHQKNLFRITSKFRSKEHDQPVLIEKDLVPLVSKVLSKLVDIYTLKRKKEALFDLSAAIGDEDQTLKTRILQAIEELIALWLPEIQVENDQATFPANSKHNQDVLLEKVLIELQEPSSVSVIYQKWRELFPNRSITIAGIRSIVVRDKDRFFSIGRSSTYGLRKWEEERDGLMGGTIRDIIETELIKVPHPLHIDQLTLAVIRFRPTTNRKSIRQNLQIEASDRFFALKGGYIGLSKKHYEALPARTTPIIGHWFHRSFMIEFVGYPLGALIAEIMKGTGAHHDVIEAKLRLLIHEGRLIVDDRDVVLHASSTELGASATESYDGELPLEYG